MTIDAIVNNFPAYRAGHFNLDTLHARRPDSVPVGESATKLARAPHVLKTHSHRDIQAFFGRGTDALSLVENLFRGSRVICVYRDGRDVLASLYFYVQRFRPDVTALTFGQFIRMENEFDSESYSGTMDRVQYWNFHLRSWLDADDVLFLSYEELLNHYETAVRRIGSFLSMDFPRHVVDVRRRGGCLSGTRAYRLVSKLKRMLIDPHIRLGPRFTSVEFRRGARGDHTSVFAREDLDYFLSLSGDLPRHVLNLAYSP